MGLVGLEVAEVAASTESSAAATTASPGPPPNPKSPSEAATTAATTSAGCLRERLIEFLVFHVLAHLVEVDSGEWICCPALSADGDRFVGEVGIVCQRRELSVRAGVCASCLNEARGCAKQAEVLRAAARKLPQALRKLSSLVRTFLLRGARGQGQGRSRPADRAMWR